MNDADTIIVDRTPDTTEADAVEPTDGDGPTPPADDHRAGGTTGGSLP